MSRVLGLDYGTKRIGVALSDPDRLLARPLPALAAHPKKQLIQDLSAIVQHQNVGQIVVGIPRNMDGSFGPAAENAEAWINHLKTALPVPFHTIDERLSTVQASRDLRESGKNSRDQKTLIDSASASIILQTYLDSLPPSV